MTPLRVAFDARDLAAAAPRGMVRYVLGLVRELPARGVRVTLFHRRREPLNPALLAGLPADVVGLPDRSAVHWEQVAVPLALRRGRFDLYHAPAERGVPLAAPCPVALTVHSTTAASYRDLVRRGLLPGPPGRYLGYDPNAGRWRWSRAYFRLQHRRADHVFAPSAFAAREVGRFLGVPARRRSVTPLAVPDGFDRPRDEASMARTRARLGVRPPYLLNVGGYEPHKNVPGLLAAFALVRQTRPDLSLVVVGSKGVPAGLAAAAGPGVVLLADLGPELVDLYDGAAAVVSLSWRETFGVPLVEAMARGVPVVASAWGAGPEVAGDGGLLVDPRDPAAAAAAVLRVLDPAARDALAAAGRERVARFDWGRTADATVTVYRRLTGERGA